ncbi:MAG: [FeFe] hydrogenase H-cluster radical SAM maturase HydE [Fibrobacteres bacterium]|nr:[FeFe] hydrogenase H-cluster radical SAM maturase HydE [Fibrobacterota bacterium]
MNKLEITKWLKETDASKLAELYEKANKIRFENVGDDVHLRGLIEISNCCCRTCGYCGISAINSKLTRYRMKREEIIECARKAVTLSYGTVVLQAGEDPGLDGKWIADIIREIKDKTPLAVTLSLGERSNEEFQLWKDAGADRYLLRFETSDETLFRKIHPPAPGQGYTNRIEILKTLKKIGYEAGSGVMIGIPGQTYETLANDILTFKELDLDMIGVGPYLPHPETPLGEEMSAGLKGENQVPNIEEMVYKVIALTRIAAPESNIPSTTALATINKATGRELGLNRGANIVMPNLTPVEYRKYYEIYPSKACIYETAEECHGCLSGRIASINRTVGKGTGSRNR